LPEIFVYAIVGLTESGEGGLARPLRSRGKRKEQGAMTELKLRVSRLYWPGEREELAEVARGTA